MAVSAALIREEGKKQLPVYYVNQAFQGAESKYLRIEKIAFALIVAAQIVTVLAGKPHLGNDGLAHQKVYEQTRGSRENDPMSN